MEVFQNKLWTVVSHFSLVYGWKAPRCYTGECSERELGGVLMQLLLGLEDVHQSNKSWQLLYCLFLGFGTISILFAILETKRFVCMLCFPGS